VDIRDYARILRKRGWIIVLLALITAVSAYGFSKLQTPEYKGYVTIQFRAARADWGLTNAAKSLLPSYRNFIANHITAQKVIDRLQLDMSTDTLLEKLTTSADEATFTIQINVEDYDGAVARDMAQAFAEIFIQDQTAWNQQQDKQDRVEAFLLDNARYKLSKPNTKINTLAGSIMGALLGGLIVFFLEWLESDILRTVEDVERAVGVAVVGAIPSSGEATSGNKRSRTWAVGLVRLWSSPWVTFGAGCVVGGLLMAAILILL